MEVAYQESSVFLDGIKRHMSVKGIGHNFFGWDLLMHFWLDWKAIGLAMLEIATAKVDRSEIFKNRFNTSNAIKEE